MSVTTAEIIELYVASFGRAPRKSELEALETASAGKTKSEVAADMIESSGSFASADNTAFLNEAYQAFFGRVADAEGLAFWGAALEAGLSRADLIAELVAGADNYPAEGANAAEAAKDKAIAANKKAVATYFAESGIEDEAQASEVLDGVTEDPATVDSAKDVIDEATQVPGETFTLVSGAEVVEGTAGNDTIIAVTDNLASKRTLDQGDQIDGGEGNDVLKVALGANFNGFTGDGYLKNVETIELTNESNFARTFNANGIEGVTEYVVNATTKDVKVTNIKELLDVITVNGQKEGTLDFTYAAAAVSGSDDALTLALNSVGSAKTTTAAQINLAVSIAGIEDLSLDVAGNNFVNLTSVTEAKTISVLGSGNVDITAVAAGVTAFDASAATGTVTANLAGAGTFTTIMGGAGKDTITVDGTELDIIATLDGGEGYDVLTINNATSGAADNTLALNMQNFEELRINGAATQELTFAAASVSGLEKVVLGTMGVGGSVVLAQMQAENMTLQLQTATAGSATVGKATYDGYGELTITTGDAANDKTAPRETEIEVISNNASIVNVNVAARTALNSDILLTAADQLTLNVATGKASEAIGVTHVKGDELTSFGGSINAQVATSVIIDAKGLLDGATIEANQAESVVADVAAGDLTLITGKVESIEMKATGAFQINDDSDLSALNSLVLTTGKVFTFEDANVNGLAELAYVQVDGNGSMTFGNNAIGADQEGVTVAATELLGGITVIVDDAASVAGSTAAVYGSTIGKNTIEIGARAEVELTGGVSADVFTVDLNVNVDQNITITGGAGNDKFVIGSTYQNKNIVTITDFNSGDAFHIDGTDKIAASTVADTYDLNDAVAFLLDAGMSGATTNNVSVQEFDAAAEDVTAIYYGGDTYFVIGNSDGNFDAGEVLLKLQGVTTVTAAQVTALFDLTV
ncbi:Hemolysin-type calcium-binding region [Desulfurispirillum indicum S5]|uniref:Hemolysin-type calcium-binding region n=1 Tax=Desulfurispirillum indicum (strain ATCC BAA-1389 / DSM 22839 / S5) TaxID=653733 RepID=E6W649_DESIS|nr:DUF4214 domain-containing protein [Desulfurispirillum indicum]ADU64988.1 Hemolysin-type calcium-binding region [Desulfurispirillum indicum S5]